MDPLAKNWGKAGVHSSTRRMCKGDKETAYKNDEVGAAETSGEAALPTLPFYKVGGLVFKAPFP